MDTSINIIPSIDFVNKKRRGEELAIGPARAFFLPQISFSYTVENVC